jgi:carbamoyl-phosphate synthase large subunit
LSELTNTSEDIIRKRRSALKVLPVYKKVDTCAAEFKSFTPYMYSTYQRSFSLNAECEADPSSKKKIVILGGGPNRIGQGIEFDYCCCQASFSLKDAGFETIMVNCNPETVSTDYDTSDRLYFEPLKEEYVFNIIKKEQENGNLIGVIAQFGGQTPIKLAKFLHDNKLPILGTQYTSIDLAEDRDRFRNLLNKLDLKQAESGIAKTYNQAIQIAEKIGLPLMVRPSYVLGGRAMEIVHDKSQLKNFVLEAFKAANNNPILIDKFLDHAMEVDVDALSDGKEVYVAGIMQHIEEAGIHSGDSACCLPPVSIKPYLVKEIENQTKKLALALKVKGFMNIQFAIKKDEIYVIEVNPRASRTVPFVSKAKGLPLAKIASRVMAGEQLSKFSLKEKTKNMYAVKEAVFPFNKFPQSDVLLGPEMKSTGEVMGFDKDFGIAYAKSQISAYNSLPTKGLAFISLKNSHKDEGIDLAKELIKLNFTLCATKGTAEYIRKFGMKCKIINKVSSGRPHIVDVLDSKKIALVINTGGGNSEHRLNDAIALRRATLKNKVPYCTNMSTAMACLQGIKSLKTKKLEVNSLQDI